MTKSVQPRDKVSRHHGSYKSNPVQISARAWPLEFVLLSREIIAGRIPMDLDREREGEASLGVIMPGMKRPRLLV